MSKPGELTISAEEAARILGVKVQTLAVWRSSKRHRIPYTKAGSKVRYYESDLLAWLKSREVDGASDASDAGKTLASVGS